MTTNTNNGNAIPKARPARRDLSWSAFLSLKPPKSIADNVYDAVDGDGWFEPASIEFLRRHDISRVYAPGLAP